MIQGCPLLINVYRQGHESFFSFSPVLTLEAGRLRYQAALEDLRDKGFRGWLILRFFWLPCNHLLMHGVE
jgi:uncharacterized metal-binding protein